MLKSQLTIPGLQRAAKRECVSCGGAADSFCARCGVTPYCSAQCQRRDWHERHQAVCHNLARLNEVLDVNNEVVIEQPALSSMRRPHSPASSRGQRNDRDDGADNGPKKFPPNNRQGGQRPNRQDGNSRQEGQGRHEGQNNRHEGQNNRHEGQNNRHEGQNNRHEGQNTRHEGQNNRHEGQNRQGGQNRQYDRPPRQFNLPDVQKSMRRPQVVDDENSGGTGRQYNRKGQQKNSFAAKRQYLIDRAAMQQSPEDEESWEYSTKPNTPATRDGPKPSVPPTKTPPAKQQGEMKPPMGGPVANKPANQNTPSPAKAPMSTATPPQAAAAPHPASNAKPPANNADVTPARKLVPKQYLIETLSTGDIVLVQVESTAKECEAGDRGFVCLSLGESHTEQYQALCESYEQRDTAALTPTPGETVSFKNPEDGAWYRARVLSPTKAALLDSPKIVPLDSNSVLARLPQAYHSIPEYCCVLQAEVKVGESYTCTLLEKTGLGYAVSLEAEDGSVIKGEVSRWLPAVCHPTPTKPAANSQPNVIPSVPRPPVTNNMTVLLVHTTSGPEAESQPAELFVRPTDAASQRAYDAALHDTVACGLAATPLTQPPRAGQYVIAKYEDAPYRALVRRTSQAKNKYLLEYLEFGNTHVNQLENLYPCPPHLMPDQKPIMTSRVSLKQTTAHPITAAAQSYLDALKEDVELILKPIMTSCVVLKQTTAHPITAAAQSYLDALKEDVELILTLPNGAASAPSGSEVILTVAKNKENVNSRVEELCTPQWLALQQSGKDILEVERLMYASLKYLELERAGGEMTVLDMSALEQGCVSACLSGHPHGQFVLTQLTERMNAYCEQEKEPYLPAVEELCLAQLPPYPQWFRATVIAHEPGAATAELCYIDYGNMETVPVSLLRKMLPEFVEGIPALACTLFIKDFPKKPTEQQLLRAAQFMQINEEGQGTLTVTNCVMEDQSLAGWYTVEAPALIQAMGQ